MKEENITVIICRPHQVAQIEVIPNCLEAMKMIVGGGMILYLLYMVIITFLQLIISKKMA